MPYMWADTLLVAERAHLARSVIWAAASVLVGTGLLAWLRIGRRQSPLLEHFAIQTAAWGAVELVFAVVAGVSLAPRDVSGATRLDRFLWFNIGLDVGYVLIGITLAVAGWRLARRLGLVGAGIGILVQGSALLLLDLILASRISR